MFGCGLFRSSNSRVARYETKKAPKNDSNSMGDIGAAGAFQQPPPLAQLEAAPRMPTLLEDGPAASSRDSFASKRDSYVSSNRDSFISFSDRDSFKALPSLQIVSPDTEQHLASGRRKSCLTVPTARRPRQSVWMAEADGSLNDDASKAEILLRQAREMDEEDAEATPVDDPRSEAPIIALVAHDNMKPLMVTFIKEYKDMLKDFRLTGTETTCKTLRGVGLEPEDMFVVSGPLGGDQALGYFITTGQVRGMFFFRDPLSAHAHAADIEALSRLADVYQIYFASNYRSAAGLLETMHGNLVHRKENSSMEHRSSVRVPEGMSSDIGQHVQGEYKKTRAGVVANALK